MPKAHIWQHDTGFGPLAFSRMEREEFFLFFYYYFFDLSKIYAIFFCKNVNLPPVHPTVNGLTAGSFGGTYLPPDELAEGATAELQPALAAL